MRGLNKVGKRSYCSYFSYFSYFPAVGARQVEAQVADARAKGAKVLCGGARAEAGGLIFEPTVLADVTRDMSCFADETFGPLCPIVAFETDAEAISIANDTRVPPSLATRALPCQPAGVQARLAVQKSTLGWVEMLHTYARTHTHTHTHARTHAHTHTHTNTHTRPQ